MNGSTELEYNPKEKQDMLDNWEAKRKASKEKS